MNTIRWLLALSVLLCAPFAYAQDVEEGEDPFRDESREERSEDTDADDGEGEYIDEPQRWLRFLISLLVKNGQVLRNIKDAARQS